MRKEFIAAILGSALSLSVSEVRASDGEGLPPAPTYGSLAEPQQENLTLPCADEEQETHAHADVLWPEVAAAPAVQMQRNEYEEEEDYSYSGFYDPCANPDPGSRGTPRASGR